MDTNELKIPKAEAARFEELVRKALKWGEAVIKDKCGRKLDPTDRKLLRFGIVCGIQTVMDAAREFDEENKGFSE